MSYEIISGIRFNPKKEVLEFKSHSNNDDADPEWWVFAPKKETFKERLLACYEDMWDGNISINGYTGQALKFNYAYSKYNEYLKKHNENASLDNVYMFQGYLEEKDLNENKVIKIGNDCYVYKVSTHGLHYCYGVDNAITFTNKQIYLIQKRYSNTKMIIETLGGETEKSKEEERFYNIIGERFKDFMDMATNTNFGEQFVANAKLKASVCVRILADYEMVDYKAMRNVLNDKYNTTLDI